LSATATACHMVAKSVDDVRRMEKRTQLILQEKMM
jgi:hypothetical protein